MGRHPRVAAMFASLCAVAAAAQAHPKAANDYCTPGPYTVYFDWRSSRIGVEAIPILDNMLDNLDFCGSTVKRVEIEGFTDASEAPRLSLARARTIQRYMRAHNVKLRLRPHGNGADRPRVPTAAGVRERQNRRVEISFSEWL